MESLLTAFLLFLAALTALLSYMFVPKMPIIALSTAAAVALALGIWWHWTQFAIDYRLSTWLEGLRNYASYVMVLVVILLSYAFYVFSWNGGTLQGLASQAASSVRDAGRRATARLATSVSRAANAASNTLFSEVTPEGPAEAPPVAE
jgi:hypothetical protein